MRLPIPAGETTMIIFYLTIPFMLLATAIAVVPLVVAMKNEHSLQDATPRPVVRGSQRESELLAP